MTSRDPQEAMDLANAYATISREFIALTMDTAQPNLFEDAVLPEKPSSPNKALNTFLGFILGAALSFAWIALHLIYDDKIHTSEEIENLLGIPTLGLMPDVTEKPSYMKKLEKSRRKKVHANEKG